MWAAGRSRRAPLRGRCRRRKRCGSRDMPSSVAAAMLPSVRLLCSAPPCRAACRDGREAERVLGLRVSRPRPPRPSLPSASVSAFSARVHQCNIPLCHLPQCSCLPVTVPLGARVSQQNIPLHHVPQHPCPSVPVSPWATSFTACIPQCPKSPASVPEACTPSQPHAGGMHTDKPEVLISKEQACSWQPLPAPTPLSGLQITPQNHPRYLAHGPLGLLLSCSCDKPLLLGLDVLLGLHRCSPQGICHPTVPKKRRSQGDSLVLMMLEDRHGHIGWKSTSWEPRQLYTCMLTCRQPAGRPRAVAGVSHTPPASAAVRAVALCSS